MAIWLNAIWKGGNMSRGDKIRVLAEMRQTSLQGIREDIKEGFVPGAYARKNNKRYTFSFSPDLIAELERWESKRRKQDVVNR